MKILGMRSGRTVSGMSRIVQILAPEIEVDCQQDATNLEDYDGMLLHNRVDDPSHGKLKRIVFMASNGAYRLATDDGPHNMYLNNPPAALWVNSEEARRILEASGITGAQVMYRPNRLVIPDEIPPFPAEPKILWHWGLTWLSAMPVCLELEISAAMQKMNDVKIRIISGVRHANVKPRGPGLEHVDPEGYLPFPDNIQDYHGVVRVYNALDFGRGTFQAFAYGRWYLYINSCEHLVNNVKEVAQIPGKVHRLIAKRDMDKAMERHQWIKDNFTEEILTARWSAAVRKVLNG